MDATDQNRRVGLRLAERVAELAAAFGEPRLPVSFDVESAAGFLLVRIAHAAFTLDTSDRFFGLELEDMVAEMERVALSSRREIVQALLGGNFASMIHTTAFAREWLVWNAGGRATPAWASDISAMLGGARGDQDVLIPARHDAAGRGALLSFRDWRLHCRIPLRSGAHYRTQGRGRIVLAGPLPETLVLGLGDGGECGNDVRLLADVVEMAGSVGVHTPLGRVWNDGGDATVELIDDLVSIAPAPRHSSRALADPGPPHAPWHLSAATMERVSRLVADIRALGR